MRKKILSMNLMHLNGDISTCYSSCLESKHVAFVVSNEGTADECVGRSIFRQKNPLDARLGRIKLSKIRLSSVTESSHLDAVGIHLVETS